MNGCRHNTKGFTLVELIMSLFVIGLMTGAVVWTLPSGRTDVDKEAVRLAARLKSTAQESILSGEVLGVSVNNDRYAFHRFRRGQWLRLNDGAIFEDRTLSPGVGVRLVPMGQAFMRLANEISSVSETGDFLDQPNLVFYPVGMNEPFQIMVSSEDGSVHVRGTASGDIQVVQTDAR
ncbi:MAG: prepilin-type N-terminal cleavage/methylation domain-containing protein [Rhodospirillaceae bacterium]